jgi:hypothetical protein
LYHRSAVQILPVLRESRRPVQKGIAHRPKPWYNVRIVSRPLYDEEEARMEPITVLGETWQVVGVSDRESVAVARVQEDATRNCLGVSTRSYWLCTP